MESCPRRDESPEIELHSMTKDCTHRNWWRTRVGRTPATRGRLISLDFRIAISLSHKAGGHLSRGLTSSTQTVPQRGEQRSDTASRL